MPVQHQTHIIQCHQSHSSHLRRSQSLKSGPVSFVPTICSNFPTSSCHISAGEPSSCIGATIACVHCRMVGGKNGSAWGHGPCPIQFRGAIVSTIRVLVLMCGASGVAELGAATLFFSLIGASGATSDISTLGRQAWEEACRLRRRRCVAAGEGPRRHGRRRRGGGHAGRRGELRDRAVSGRSMMEEQEREQGHESNDKLCCSYIGSVVPSPQPVIC